MSSQSLVLIGWLVHFMLCHYIIRRISNQMTRMVSTTLPCVVLTYMVCRDLPLNLMSSILIAATCWMASIRIIQLIVFSPNENYPIYSFIFKVYWILFPIIPSEKMEKQWPILFDFICGVVKLVINHWIFRWLVRCGPSDNYARMIMMSVMLLTTSYISDIQIGLVRIVTRNRYTLVSISNFPLLSKSLCEFWGRRYNRLTSTVLRECVFQPVNACFTSPMLAAMSTFIVSGLLHVHAVLVAFNDSQAIVPTFVFFLLHGAVCCLEKSMAIRLPAPLGWLLTYSFLLITLPLSVGPYTRQGPLHFERSPPPLSDSKWIPQIPVPESCLS